MKEKISTNNYDPYEGGLPEAFFVDPDIKQREKANKASFNGDEEVKKAMEEWTQIG